MAVRQRPSIPCKSRLSADTAFAAVRLWPFASVTFWGILRGISECPVFSAPNAMPRTVEPLTDTKIRNAKPREKAYKVSTVEASTSR
ncbi:hypothetical protein CBM2587_A170057 [Cupriavidus taiwanensis]|uniref:Uncharacterized protein n=1 Tax=Cupriavidus taiwanensis TaxID=164546 RepID=A0A375BMQ9_9BURK|nr:hypothetical protein CBM2587_A170057 [Cupriavidus taiwanensis]